MEISSGISNRQVQIQTNKRSEQPVNKNVKVSDNKDSLPLTSFQGISMLNTEVPVSYTKIGEIFVPGLAQKASLFKLSNGQKVVICPKKGPTYIKTTYNVGSFNETDDIRGISHFIEHNLFNGSKDLKPQEYNSKVAKMGGVTNASTFLSVTDYYLGLQLLNENSLEEAIKLNASQTQFPSFPAEQLEKEKEPVKSEIDVYKDKPDCAAQNIILKDLFGIKSASYDLTLGTKDNINALNKEKVQDYFDTWYTPDNALTVITGDVDVNETIALVSKYFNKQNNYSKVNKRFYQPLDYIKQTKRTDIVMPNSVNSSITMGFAIPEGTTKEDMVKVESLLSLLRSDESRLSKALDSYGIKPYFEIIDAQNKPDGAKAVICYVNSPEDKLEEVLNIVFRELSNISLYPPSYQELNNVKNKSIYELNSVSDDSEYLNTVLTEAVKNNYSDYFVQKINTINSITPNDISDTARKFLDLNKTAVCVSHAKTGTTTNNVSFGRSISVSDSLNAEAQKVSEFILPNNIHTKFVPCSSNLKSSFYMEFKTDELNDVSDPAMQVLTELLNRGNAYRNYDTIRTFKNSRDLDYTFSASVDGLTCSGSFYNQDANDVLALVKETLFNPNYSEAEFQRAKEIIKNRILAENKSPKEKLFKEIFPSLKIFDLKEDRLQALDTLTLADIQNLYARILSTSQVQTTISAPVEENPYIYNVYNNALSFGLPIFRPSTKEKSPSYNIYQPIQQAVTLKEVEDNTQANITRAYTFKQSKNIDDIAKIRLLDVILGSGGMKSRLFVDLREKEKLAYHTSSCLLNEKNLGMILMDIETTTQSPDPKEGSPENVNKALDGFNRNVEALKNSYVSQEELDNAKTILKTRILNDMETTASKMIQFHLMEDSPYDNAYNQALIEAIDKVSVSDIKDAANYVFKNPPVTSIMASQSTFDALNI